MNVHTIAIIHDHENEIHGPDRNENGPCAPIRVDRRRAVCGFYEFLCCSRSFRAVSQAKQHFDSSHVVKWFVSSNR